MLFVYLYFLLLYHYDFVLINLLRKLEIMQSLICQLPKENQYFLQKPANTPKTAKTQGLRVFAELPRVFANLAQTQTQTYIHHVYVNICEICLCIYTHTNV